jgi:hypothetical protein
MLYLAAMNPVLHRETNNSGASRNIEMRAARRPGAGRPDGAGA